ncbi:MAG: MBL fold metallo-hydrolase [Coriobacteriia bacterium]|nr:MBL fold metallo-hydrolase [Coriobacteriia bacterium]MCL2749506.1 MBL fold metallo-hydrolase [Coriobacteriia bacterium]
MPTKLFENPPIYCIDIPLPNNPLRNLNCYVLKSEGETLIVDTGFRLPECEQALLAGLKELEVDFSKASLFITHFHADHCGLVETMLKYGCKVYMGELDYELLCVSINAKRLISDFKQEGYPPGELQKQLEVNPAHVYAPFCVFPVEEVEEGYTLKIGSCALTTIATPGHTPGHLCLYLAEHEVMFTGDHVLFGISPNISVFPRFDNPLKEYLASLDKISRYPVKLALTSHRAIGTSITERIEEIKEHHQERLDFAHDLIRQFPNLTAYELASRFKWKMRGKGWDDFPIQQKWFAVGETLAHLNWLLYDGQIEKWLDGNSYRYRLTE